MDVVDAISVVNKEYVLSMLLLCCYFVFIDNGVVALVSSSSVSSCLREGGFDTKHNFISCDFISFSPLVVLALVAPPSDASPTFHCLTSGEY